MKRSLVVLVLLTVVVFVLLLTSKRPSPPDSLGLDMSQERPIAPDFELTDLAGSSVSLSSLRGKVVLVNFWATWCPPCRQEIPSMDRLYQLLKGEGVELLAINIETDGPVVVPKFMQKLPFSFPVLFDADGMVQRQFGVSKYPETFIVDPEGVVRERVIGAVDWNNPQMIVYLRSLLKVGVSAAE